MTVLFWCVKQIDEVRLKNNQVKICFSIYIYIFAVANFDKDLIRWLCVLPGRIYYLGLLSMEKQGFLDSNLIKGDAEKYLRYAGIIDWITDAMTNCECTYLDN